MKSESIEPYVIGNVFVVIELICISFYYGKQLFSRKAAFRALHILLILGFITQTIFNGIYEFNFLGLGILCTVYIGYGIAGYLRIIQSKEIIYVTRLPFFWINSAFFLYATSGCLLFLFTPFLKAESLQLILALWTNFFVAMNILRYIFIGIGLYKTKKVEA